jgi:hypothetical protein
MVSSLSPDSAELALIFSSLLSRRSRMAPERSSANCATRWMAADSSLERTTANLVLSRGITASKLGNWPESLRVLSVRWPTRKKSVCSSSANSTFSASEAESNCCSSWSALRGMRTRFSPLMPSRTLVGLFDVGQPVAVGGHHGQRLGLDDQQRAVERVARLLIRDGEDGARDERLQRQGGDAGDGDRRKLGHLGIVGARHADHLGVRAAAANLHPVVVEQLDGDVAFGQQLDVVVELARGNGAGARLLHLGRGAGADGLVEVGGRDVEPVALGLDEKVRQNRNGGLALDHALRRGKLLHQILAAYGNLHRCPLRGRLLYFCFHDRHNPPSLCGYKKTN